MPKPRRPVQDSRPPSTPREFELFDDLMPVRRYKLLLQTFLKRRGAGKRQAIADALGHTRSFVTQMTSPAYDLAIPAQHVRRIVGLAGLETNEARMFLEAYLDAHPERAAEVLGAGRGSDRTRTLTIEVPLLRSAAAQRRMESLIARLAADVAAAMADGDGDEAGAARDDAEGLRVA